MPVVCIREVWNSRYAKSGSSRANRRQLELSHVLQKVQNRYHIRYICTCFLCWITFLLSYSSENFPKHVYPAKPSQILMGPCQLLCSLIPTPPSTLLLLLTFLWPSVTGPQCSGYSTSCSQCLKKNQQGQFIPPFWLHIVLVQIILLLSSFTVCPHIISLSNYFPSACCAVFSRRMFLPARPAPGLLIFLSLVSISTPSIQIHCDFPASLLLFPFPHFLFPHSYSCANTRFRVCYTFHVMASSASSKLSCYFQVANSTVLPSPRHLGCQWSPLHFSQNLL